MADRPDPELKPCPFCGHRDVFFSAERSDAFSVVYNTIGCVEMNGRIFEKRQDLAARWNTRVEVDTND